MKSKIQKLREELEDEAKSYRENLSPKNIEKSIEYLIALLYWKLSDKDVKLLEQYIRKAKLKTLNKVIEIVGEDIEEVIGDSELGEKNYMERYDFVIRTLKELKSKLGITEKKK